MSNQDPELSLEEFLKKCNNFPEYFVNDCEHLYRKRPYFLKFQQQHSDLEEKLTKKITDVWRKKGYNEVIGLFADRLYEAYKLMRVNVKSDNVLFR